MKTTIKSVSFSYPNSSAPAERAVIHYFSGKTRVIIFAKGDTVPFTACEFCFKAPNKTVHVQKSTGYITRTFSI